MIRMNVEAFYKLQGDMSDSAFARKLGISRSQLFRVRKGESSVGESFIEKFMICYPDKLLNDYFFTRSVPQAAHESDDGTESHIFFTQGVPLTAQKSNDGTAGRKGDAP